MAALNTNAEAASLTSKPSTLPFFVFSKAASLGTGQLSLIKSIKVSTPWSVFAAVHSTGKVLPLSMPKCNPFLISSSVSVPSSKNFSMSDSSFSAAFSIRVLCNSSAFAFSLSGISLTTAVPPLEGKLSCFICSTSITVSNPTPALIGY